MRVAADYITIQQLRRMLWVNDNMLAMWHRLGLPHHETNGEIRYDPVEVVSFVRQQLVGSGDNRKLDQTIARFASAYQYKPEEVWRKVQENRGVMLDVDLVAVIRWGTRARWTDSPLRRLVRAIRARELEVAAANRLGITPKQMSEIARGTGASHSNVQRAARAVLDGKETGKKAWKEALEHANSSG